MCRCCCCPFSFGSGCDILGCNKIHDPSDHASLRANGLGNTVGYETGLLDTMLHSSCVVESATVKRYSWTRTRMTGFFADIVGNWSDKEFKSNF